MDERGSKSKCIARIVEAICRQFHERLRWWWWHSRKWNQSFSFSAQRRGTLIHKRLRTSSCFRDGRQFLTVLLVQLITWQSSARGDTSWPDCLDEHSVVMLKTCGLCVGCNSAKYYYASQQKGMDGWMYSTLKTFNCSSFLLSSGRK